MTVSLAWLRAAAAAAVAVSVGVGPAAAQALPYRNTTPTGAANPAARYAAAVPVVAPPAATPPGFAAIPQAVYPTTQPPYGTAPVDAAVQQGYPAAQQPQYAPYRPQPATARIAAQPYPTTNALIGDRYSYTAVAQQTDGPTPSNTELPPPAIVDEVVPLDNGPETNGPNGATNGTNGTTNRAATNGAAEPTAVEGYNSYHNGHGYPTTDIHTYGNGYGACDCNTSHDYGLGRYFDDECSTTQWFGGVYFLYMERDNPSYRKFTANVDTSAISYPYFPPARVTALSTEDIDYDFAPGLEVRFGSTFSIGGYDWDRYGYNKYGFHGYGHGSGCGTDCGSCAPADMYAWEFVWWGLDEDDQSAMIVNQVPAGPMRLYGLSSHAGLRYMGNIDRPVDDYYDYQMPITDDSPPITHDVRVTRQSVRTYFSAQNLELNFLRFPVCYVGCGGCNTGCASYDACGYDAYGGYAPACEPAGGPSFSIAGLCGVRYFRTDDDFVWSTQWSRYDGAAWVGSNDELFHDIEVDNQLVGFQLGSIMNYCVASKWNFFLDTKFGLYNNHIEHYQRVFSNNGNYAYYEETGEGMVVESDKDDVAFLGEMRLGGSYDLSCHWRAVLAYRAVAITGVALSVDQLKSEYSNWADTARIDSDGSIVIHGVQIGAECKY